MITNDGGVINNPTEPQTVQSFSSLNQRGNKFVFLSTAIVGVWSPLLKSYIRCRVILDSASQSHFMTLQFASKLGLEKEKINLAVSGLSENSTNINWKINDAFISNKDSSYTSPLDFLIVPRITDFVPSIQPNLKFKKFNDINRSILADPSFDKPGKIDMIIGAELFYQILKDGRKLSETAISSVSMLEIQKYTTRELEESKPKLWATPSREDNSPHSAVMPMRLTFCFHV
ncbi:DUF1758 domain-containing protein [Trichonephila clavata]|uniref:DUF1758 domain-containing protein n=1 Tax=Trichonephila clavata TaxID=2740835 RepID=A0A8X6LL08_TRICU|nr:DUF1758 domain-containing protein [Trichonephila clavata]